MSSDKKQNEESQRRSFSPEQKIKILRQHLLEKTPISEVCEKHEITPTQFYQWQKTLFENGPAAFAKTSGRRPHNQAEARLAKLEDKLKRKDEVIAEIMAEYVALKKNLGES
jgi:transposase-like protein